MLASTPVEALNTSKLAEGTGVVVFLGKRMDANHRG